MRLLECESDGRLKFHEFNDGDVPTYAILSHTWNVDNKEEVSYQDVETGNSESKAGYQKVRFCVQQAAADGLRYFWVDTCCIDKRNNTELSKAITSMFRWYQRAARCYVYLSDVPTQSSNTGIRQPDDAWELAFRKSRWFTRGWTLQELIAPSSVEFFSSEGERLGNKLTLEGTIHDITGIPTNVLIQGLSSDLTVDERMSWAANRHTKEPEDEAYSLLGIFDISMPLLYGEGREKALRRLHEEINKSRTVSAHYSSIRNDPLVGRRSIPWTFEESHVACLRSLCFSALDARQNDIAPAHPDTCDWLFETTEFCKWRDRVDLVDHNGVLWLKGKPGVGKSTLMKHTLHYYKQEFGDYSVVAYFFNARGEQLEKTALGLLRSMVYQLIQGDNTIRDHFLLRFHEKQMMQEGGRPEWRMSDLRDFILSAIKQRHLKSTILLVDALDECSESDVRDVVEMLEKLSVEAVRSKAELRICLSSRHYPSIDMKKKLELTVENDEQHRRDIIKYITDQFEIDDKGTRHAVQEKADGVFLWAVLVVSILNQAVRAGRVEEIQKTLDNLPGDLEKVFETMLAKDQTHKAETVLMLQWVLFSPRPLQPEELFCAVMTKIAPELIELWDPAKFTDKIVQRRITDSSKGLIEVRPGTSSTVQFIHRSVTDFLLRNRRLQRLDPTLATNPGRTSYRQLWSCCWEYIKLTDISRISRKHVAEVKETLPFIQLATSSIFRFADQALSDGRLGQKQQTGYRLLDGLYHLFGYPTQECEVSQWVQECSSKCFEDWKKFINTSDLYDQDLRIDMDAGLLYMSCENGYQRLVGILLSGQGADVNAQGGRYGNALQAASIQGSQEIVKMLLDAKADVNAQGGVYGNALQAASIQGSQEVVKMLLDAKADVN
ncbi:MAG: hypothetical protein M1821_008374, partial [Bathelium mastoideum]